MEEIIRCLAMTLVSHEFQALFSRGLYSIHLNTVWVHFLLLTTPGYFPVQCVRGNAIVKKVQGFAEKQVFFETKP